MAYRLLLGIIFAKQPSTKSKMLISEAPRNNPQEPPNSPRNWLISYEKYCVKVVAVLVIKASFHETACVSAAKKSSMLLTTFAVSLLPFSASLTTTLYFILVQTGGHWRRTTLSNPLAVGCLLERAMLSRV